MAAGGATPQTFAVSLLKGLGTPVTPANVKAIVGWEAAEGGHWNNSARFNPLNTTQPAPGSQTFQSVGQGSAAIRIYNSWQQGLNATIQTLQNGRYGNILAALHAGNNPSAVAQAIGSSPWGTSAAGVMGAIRGTNIAGVPTSGIPGQTSAATPNIPATTPAQTKTTTTTEPNPIIPLLQNVMKGSSVYDIGPKTSGAGGQSVLSYLPSTVTHTTTQHIAAAQGALSGVAGTSLAGHPALIQKGKSGYINPVPGAVIGRTDMGVDVNLPVGHPILAMGDSKVLAISPNWYKGQPYVLMQLTSGPQAGKYWYVAEQFSPNVRPGQTVRAGQVIGTYARSGTGIEIGWGSPRPGTTLAAATTGYREGQVTPAGSSFRNLLGSF